jgi:hypothetical protein
MRNAEGSADSTHRRAIFIDLNNPCYDLGDSPMTLLTTASSTKNRKTLLATPLAAWMMTLAVAGTVSTVVLPTTVVAQTATKTPLDKDVEDFWHFAKIGRYDAAKAKADAILAANAQPVVLLSSFEAAAAAARGDDLTQWMLRFQNVADIKESAEALQKALADGRFARRADPDFIDQQIKRLTVNQIAYENAVRNLKSSGELAVPQLLSELKDPAKSASHGAIRKAVKDMGRDALNPLVAATETKDVDLLNQVIGLLGESGYSDVAPYLERLTVAEQPESVRASAQTALGRLGVSPSDAGTAFYDLAEKFYTGKSAISFDNRNPLAFVWFYGENGLEKKDVPHAVFAEIMTLRASEYALELGGADTTGELGTKSLALWLVANYKREVELAGAADPTRKEDQPGAHYYGVTAGTRFLDLSLSRALSDGDSAVAYEILKSQQDIAGVSNTDLTSDANPLVAAMQYPDRRVRFESAFAVANARKAGVTFEGSDLVVPLLGEAVSQTGQPSVLVVAANADSANTLVEPLKAAGALANSVTAASDVNTTAAGVPSVDVVILSKDLSPEVANAVLASLNGSPKLRGAARLVQTETTQSAFEQLKLTDKLLSTTVTADVTALAGEALKLPATVGALPVDPMIATEYATRWLKLLLPNSRPSKARCCKAWPMTPDRKSFPSSATCWPSWTMPTRNRNCSPRPTRPTPRPISK